MFWSALTATCRLFMIFVRAIPEYVWAFLFLALLGPISWPLVLALAVHNSGILRSLGAEVVENTESPALKSLRALGAGRAQIVLSAVFPMAFSRFLLFFLYRWETCVREAPVLGLLGISSLGFWIQDARARNHYDEMFFLILLGGALVLGGDLLSALAREWVRREA
jgi:phosphonate transport system permease protein